MNKTITPTIEPLVPIAPITPMEQVTDAQLARYADLIYSRTGIRVSPQKKTLLSNRLRRRLRATGIKDFEEYFRHLKKLGACDAEWDAFLQEITTHETYLFRDEAQWKWFRETFLTDLSEAARKGTRKRTLRIWSAACSTGDEATTVACCIAAGLSNSQQWSIQILGTDIGVGAVEQARSAVFGERAMRLVPADLRKRFFTQAKDSLTWKAKPALTKLTSFQRHNLMDSFRQKQFDLVFLKNVLIYFDANSKAKVMTNILASILPGGLLVAGASEGVSDMLKGCQRIESWLYRKPIK
jgi:chemotaxis protein methyltransferase CheR